jgi:hypothetical protein
LLADHFRCQAGSYDAAYKLLSETLEVEEKELGARPEQMADLLFLMADILSEVRADWWRIESSTFNYEY